MVEEIKKKYLPHELTEGLPYTDDVRDYHFICDINTPKDIRSSKLNMGDIYINAVKCKRCGDYIRSKNRHDYRTCSCGACAVDGGSLYMKRSGNLEDMEDMSVLFKDNSIPTNDKGE
jgi:hypothetical protein